MDDQLFLLTIYAGGRRIGLEIDSDPGKLTARAKGWPGCTTKLWECKEIPMPKAEKE
jgi:hypothetical protein